MKKTKFTELIKAFDFKTLFNEFGWDNFNNKLPVAVNADAFMLTGIAEKKGFVILQCPALYNGKIPTSDIRKQIENKVAKHYFEHLIIYTDNSQNQQIWQLAVKEENKPKQVREVNWYSHQDVESIFQRMKNLLFTLDEEEKITIVDVKQRISENFAKNSDQVTKKFYTDFKKQHVAFLDFIQGIDDHIGNKTNENKQWYASLMLNRLMFCYFIQKKGFLDQDLNYLQNKLNACENLGGSSNFYSFYRSFLLELFHDGLGKPQTKRTSKPPVDLGKIPYLNGGLFDVHELERQFDQIEIKDDAFKKIFNFFDQWNWHLDNSIEATGKDINPDVIGYIFEKYINDRASMGAYYTKEDITDYIGKNTVIPFLFDETERNYKEVFKPNSELWSFIKESNDAYIYDAVKHGIPDTYDLFADLPDDIQEGVNHALENNIVKESTSPHLWEIRNTWNQKTPEDIGLPTEIYRELIERRKRYADIKAKIVSGEISSINDFITYNLNIRQFTQDFIENTQDATFIRHFYKAIIKITILDPTCGSGAFLFAALNILEPLYEACIIRMEQFVAEEPNKHKFFEEVLTDVKSEHHPSLQYFIYKSIILNNLYGVDIMNEAVEIAKLRLFLKLVATVDVNPRKDNFGLEPLPDIDFNIRAGNTLIGFATETELLQTIQKKDALFADAILEEFKEEFHLVSKAFSHFQNSQLINDQGSDSFKKAKATLLSKLTELNNKLNVYLANNYGITDVNKEVEIELIDANKKKVKEKVNHYQHWLKTHQPFHWFAEFYQIVAVNGGFDCIIGNPPYVEYAVTRKHYKLANDNFITEKSGNLFAYVMERSLMLSNQKAKVGMIIPLSAFCTARMEIMNELFINNCSFNYISYFGFRPAKLFEGANRTIGIGIYDKSFSENKTLTYTTAYRKWSSDYREFLFESINYYSFSTFYLKNQFPKIESNLENSILSKVFSKSKTVANYRNKSLKKHCIYYRNVGGLYWKIITNFAPEFYDNGKKTSSSRESHLFFSTEQERDIILSLFNSNLFWFYYNMTSDCWSLNPSDLLGMPINIDEIPKQLQDNLIKKGKDLMDDFKLRATWAERIHKGKNKTRFQQFTPRLSKNIIDEIDRILSKYYDFTNEELDFIINYDIKYRMGKSLFGEAKEELGMVAEERETYKTNS